MKIIIFGATGGTGKALARTLLDEGHQVSVFARDSQRLPLNLHATPIVGDAMQSAAVHQAMTGHDTVLNCLGNSQSSHSLLFGAKRTTAADICTVGTGNIIAGMREQRIERLIVVSAYGVGSTRTQAPWMFKLYFKLLLREHMRDKEAMEVLVKASTLDWTLVQPPALVDAADSDDIRWFGSETGQLGKTTISREAVSVYISSIINDTSTYQKTISLSGATE